MRRTSILSCFTPPDAYYGDFGWVSGFTAHPDVLEEMAVRFTQGARLRRPSLAIFLHPPEKHVALRRGVTVPFRRAGVPWNFQLLHAKIALLHFHGDLGSVLRLVVSTGNWTHDPLETSIDLYWIVEWHEKAADRQAAADILAAAAMFGWIRDYFDTSVLEIESGQGLPEERLRAALRKLEMSRLPRSRFIDTRKEALQTQVIRALTKQPVRRNRLIMGSGYFEVGENADVGVLTSFKRELVKHGLATETCKVDVILNADACQGLATQKDALKALQWTLRPPRSPYLPHAKLHAKFLFSAGGKVGCTNPWCYIGSGNLSRVGFTRAIGSGNLEAGVVFVPKDHLTWTAGGAQALSSRLPIDLDTTIDPSSLSDGEIYQEPGRPADPPPVAYLLWRDGTLRLPDPSTAFPELTVRLLNGQWASLPASFEEAPAVALLGPMLAEVPVLTDQGFVLPPLGPRRVEDVLYELKFFPHLPPDERDRDTAGDIVGEEDKPMPLGETSEYPLRRMMRLIVRLTEHQAKRERHDWERWVNRLDDLLLALTEPEAEMLAAFRTYKIDPISALMHPLFLPQALLPADKKRLRFVVDKVRVRWGLETFDPLFPLRGTS